MIDLRAPLDHRHAAHARLHALKRLRQRFGIEMDIAGLAAIEAAMITGTYRWVALRRRAIAYAVPIGGKLTYPLFNVDLWATVTFLDKVDGARAAFVLRGLH